MGAKKPRVVKCVTLQIAHLFFDFLNFNPQNKTKSKQFFKIQSFHFSKRLNSFYKTIPKMTANMQNFEAASSFFAAYWPKTR